MRNLWLDEWIKSDGSPSSAVLSSASSTSSHNTNYSPYTPFYLHTVPNPLPAVTQYVTCTQRVKELKDIQFNAQKSVVWSSIFN